MARLLLYGLIAVALYAAFTGGRGMLSGLENGNAALVIRGLTPAELESRIIEHYENVVLSGARELSFSTIDTTVIDLNDDGKKDVIAIMQSDSTCGTGGCIASIFIEDEFGELTAIPFAYAVKSVEVLQSLTRGMHDLRINEDERRKMVWDGTTYVPEQI
jgi:hypothetical protein